MIIYHMDTEENYKDYKARLQAAESVCKDMEKIIFDPNADMSKKAFADFVMKVHPLIIQDVGELSYIVEKYEEMFAKVGESA